MKIKPLNSIFNSTLSCNSKCLRFFSMIHKKILIGLFCLGFLSACGAPSAMLGPAYTFTSTGSWAQAGLTYGSNELITSYTGKTPIENLEEITEPKNLQKKTLKSDNFHQLVKKRFEKTREIIKLSTQ